MALTLAFELTAFGFPWTLMQKRLIEVIHDK